MENPLEEGSDDGTEVKLENETIFTDDGIRHSTNFDFMAKLKPVFEAGTCLTVANSSRISDGAADVPMTRRSIASSLGHITSVISKRVSSFVADVATDGVAMELLATTGIAIEGLGKWEINGTIVNNALYSIGKLGLDTE